MQQSSHVDDARTDSPPSHLAALIDAALAAHRTGQPRAAESLYRQALALDPANPRVLHYFGVLHYQRGEHETAARLISEALRLDSDDAAVRLYAIRGLKEITGNTFGYRYYEDEIQRKPALDRWKQWLKDREPASKPTTNAS